MQYGHPWHLRSFKDQPPLKKSVLFLVTFSAIESDPLQGPGCVDLILDQAYEPLAFSLAGLRACEGEHEVEMCAVPEQTARQGVNLPRPRG